MKNAQKGSAASIILILVIIAVIGILYFVGRQNVFVDEYVVANVNSVIDTTEYGDETALMSDATSTPQDSSEVIDTE
jgi:hypothetical protein